MGRIAILALLCAAVDGFAPPSRTAPSPTRTAPSLSLLQASQADVQAIAGGLGDAASVEALFMVKGEPRQFLRRDQFCQALDDATSCSPDGAYEAWLGLGGAPKPAEKKKESKGFFGAFADSIKENAGGVKDTRPKDKWGDTVVEMTIVDAATILESDAGAAGFSEAAVAAWLGGGGV